MLMLAQSGSLLGGIGLFLLGMWMMTEGLRLAAGEALRDVLAHSTRTRWRALVSGIALTAVVQSSTAVTVAAIGFVNAGLLSLGQVLWVLFGSNVGTTMTGWLVAIVGLKFKIDALALPLLGLGMLLRLTGSGTRRGNAGMALAGFGVLFLGIDVLSESFSGLSAGFELPSGSGPVALLVQVFAGAALTLLMQSSSAATALTLTAAQGGMLGLESAAAVVIGANIGTTGTAMIAAIGATASARRAAAAHVLFNALTGAVALLLLPVMLQAMQWLAAVVAGGAGIAVVLALFHTCFNLLGVLLMWPLTGRLTRFLEQRFRTAEEDDARPRYLDASTATVPALAIEALSREVSRMGSIVLRAACQAALHAPPDLGRLARTQTALTALVSAIDDFVVRLNRASMTQENAVRLAAELRRAGYYANVSELLLQIASGSRQTGGRRAGLQANTIELRETAAVLLESIAPTMPVEALAPADDGALSSQPSVHAPEQGEVARQLDVRMAHWDARYRQVKAALLEAGALGTLTPTEMDQQLRSNSALRRVVQQSVKAATLAADLSSARAASAAPDQEPADLDEPVSTQAPAPTLPDALASPKAATPGNPVDNAASG